MQDESKQGYVYILTNPSFKEDWVKIGMTQNMEERLKTLDNTALPLPFKKYATLKTIKYQVAEKHVHHYIETFTNLRIRDKREFFNVKPEQALKIFCEVAELLEDAVVTKYEDGKPYQVYPVINALDVMKQGEKKDIRKPFDFDMVGLSIGDMIVFDALKLPVKVAGKNKVEYEGRLWSLSAFCGTYLPEHMQNHSGAYQGPKYFSYKGKTLWEIRLEREKSTNNNQ